MNRRQFLQGAAALAGTALPVSKALSAVDNRRVAVVELINFGCSRSREMDEHYLRLETAASAANVIFRVAPVAWTTQSLWPDRMYYAARDCFPGLEVAVRSSLFAALQQDGQRLEDLPQVVAYLESHHTFTRALSAFPEFSMAVLADYANSNETLIAELRAIRLMESSTIQELPAFLWIVDGDLVHQDTPINGDLDGLLRRVLSTFQPKGLPQD